MEERLKNVVFISICEACLLYYRKNKLMSSFHSWCYYHSNYIINDITGSQIPRDIIKLEFYILDYLNEIFGFSDDDAFPLIYEFFKEKKWIDLYEIAVLTLHIQKHLSLP